MEEQLDSFRDHMNHLLNKYLARDEWFVEISKRKTGWTDKDSSNIEIRITKEVVEDNYESRYLETKHFVLTSEEFDEIVKIESIDDIMKRLNQICGINND